MFCVAQSRLAPRPRTRSRVRRARSLLRSTTMHSDSRRYAKPAAALVKRYHDRLPSCNHRFDSGRPLFRRTSARRGMRDQSVRRPSRTPAGDRRLLAPSPRAAASMHESLDGQRLFAVQQEGADQPPAIRNLPARSSLDGTRTAPLRSDPGVRWLRSARVARLSPVSSRAPGGTPASRSARGSACASRRTAAARGPTAPWG